MTRLGRKPQIPKKGHSTQPEQIRKRRHNLFKRLAEFNDRYGMDIWMIMKTPNGRIYTFYTNPDEHVPTEEEMIENKQPVIHKTPADYASKPRDSFVIRDPPPLLLPRPPYDGNSILSAETRANRPSNNSTTKAFSGKESLHWTHSNTVHTISSPTKTVHYSPVQHSGTEKVTHPGTVQSSIAQNTLQSLYSTKPPTAFDPSVISKSVAIHDSVDHGVETTTIPPASLDLPASSLAGTLTDVSAASDDVYTHPSSIMSSTMTTLPTSYGLPIYSSNTQPSFDNGHHSSIPLSTVSNMPTIISQADSNYDEILGNNPTSTRSATSFNDIEAQTQSGLKPGDVLTSVRSLRDLDVSHTLTSSCDPDSCSSVSTHSLTQWQHSAIQLDLHPSTTSVSLPSVSSDKLQLSDTVGWETSHLKAHTTQKFNSEDQQTGTFISVFSQATTLPIAFPGPSKDVTSLHSIPRVKMTQSDTTSTSGLLETITSFTFTLSETSGSMVPAQTGSAASEQTSSTSQSPNSDNSSDSHPVLSSSVEIAAGAVGGAVCLALAVFFFTGRLRRTTGTIPIRNETNPNMSHFSFDS
ncbi:uncharacterized protein TRUGW13939_09692 [Talaromyces rugulosus]|uniref:MADS-box domain-containing protein n=1 Tax=Talaromyces rugulosus TaxID=121627 RepID=A0A7H8R9W5_TALRU|nr:uncharacterized protein TRUGW13939_09692 [Talaromyces rugulosus]QKX62531.1 hypothetical protein TRUGW13939_09692 [Talaromyces rugulosus]